MAFRRNCLLLIVVLIVVWGSQCGDAFGTFGFDVHHRYSDPVKGILDLDGLPEKGSMEYYSAMAHRDRFIRRHGGRRLADTVNSSPLTFDGGNETIQIGFLHYANVSVGTPSLSYLVALDTGSDLFWLPCDCTSCVRGLVWTSGKRIDFNIYSPNTSSTSMAVPCNSTMCGQQRRQCSTTRKACAYQILHLSSNTSSTGILVEDTLHLITDDSPLKDVDAQITLGCGIIQTGSYLDGAAPNGLFGLGMDAISVPSVLASQGLAANSFSMCFGPVGLGRIVFGDKGTSDQGETTFNIGQLRPTYNISVTQITVGKNVTDLNFTAIFDSGTSFTYLNDPVYTVISEKFNSAAKDKLHPPDSNFPFQYCYESATQSLDTVPDVNLTMEGGTQFYVTDPIIETSAQGGGYVYCLGVVKSEDINIIGQNFMTGYRIVFDREKMVLGWKASDCYDAKTSNTLPVSPQSSPAGPPDATMNPEATSGNGSPFPSSTPPPPSAGNHSPCLNSFAYTLLLTLFSLSTHYLIILSP